MTPSPRVQATRCPHCHTVFRVVADQLKLRDGLVRCGHCREVFDGRAYLCEPPGDDGEAQVTVDTADPAIDTDSEASTARTPVPEMLTPTAIAALLGTPDESRAQMQHGPGRYIDDEDPTVLPAPTATPASAKLAGASAIAPAEKPPGAARVIWRVLLTLAIIGLLAQWAWLERAALVDRFPALRDAFAAVGRPLHIAIAPARQPDTLQLSSVTLVTDDGSAASTATASTIAAASDASADAADAAIAADSVPMTLTVFMRNDAGHAVAWPSLELTLSDIDGKPVVRRVFAAGDYVADNTLRDAGLAPHNERTIRLRLSAQAALASNYRVLAFYP